LACATAVCFVFPAGLADFPVDFVLVFGEVFASDFATVFAVVFAFDFLANSLPGSFAELPFALETAEAEDFFLVVTAAVVLANGHSPNKNENKNFRQSNLQY
jgi:hypothetical protein